MQKIKIGHRANFRAKNKCFRQILFPVRAILRSINFRYADFNTDSKQKLRSEQRSKIVKSYAN